MHQGYRQFMTLTKPQAAKLTVIKRKVSHYLRRDSIKFGGLDSLTLAQILLRPSKKQNKTKVSRRRSLQVLGPPLFFYLLLVTLSKNQRALLILCFPVSSIESKQNSENKRDGFFFCA